LALTRILMHSDALELCNALWPAKGVHKVVNVYFALAEINKSQRSKTENFFLTLSVKEAYLKQYRKLSSFLGIVFFYMYRYLLYENAYAKFFWFYWIHR
jgi:hypothetical protein